MERMRYTYLRVGFIYALVSFLSNAYYIFSPGVIGFRHDWRIPYLPGQVWDRFFEAIFTWNSISGRGVSGVPNTLLYERLFELALAVLVRFNGEVLSKIIVPIIMLVSALTMFYLGKVLRFSSKSAFFMGLFYMLTPVLYNRIIAGYHLYNFAYAISPLFFAFLHKYVYYKQRCSYILTAALVFGMSAVQVQFPPMLAFMAALYLLIFAISKRNYSSLIISLKAIAILIVLFIILNSFWILTMFMNPGSKLVINKAAPIDYHEIMNAPKLLPAFLMTGYSHVYDPFYLYTHNKLPSLVIYSLLSLSILSLIASIFAINKKEQAYLAVYSLSLLSIGLFFVSALNGPFPQLWKLLYLKIPILSVFREVYHSMFIVTFAYTLLVGMLIEELHKKLSSPRSKNLLVVILLFIILSSGYPSLNSFMHQLNVLNYGNSDIEVYNFLKNESGIYRVVYVPSLSPIRYPTINRGSVDLMIKYSPKPTFPQHVTRVFPSEGILQYYVLTSIEHPERIENIHELLGKISVKYIICRPNCTSYYPYYVPMLRYLQKVYGSTILYHRWFNTSLRCDNIKHRGQILNFNNINLVQIDNSPFINVGGTPLVFSSFDDLLSGVRYLDNNFAIILNVHLREFPLINNISNTFVFTNEPLYDLYLMDSYLSTTLFVTPNAPNNRPEKSWATDLLSWYINPSIAIAPLYGENTVLTWAPPTADLPENMPISNLIASWDFTSQDQVKAWENVTPKIQFSAIQTISWDESVQALRAELYNSTWVWKTIRSPLIPVKYDHVYRFMFKVKGQNTNVVHAYVKEYDVNKTLIKGSFLYYPFIGDGTFNWKTISFNYQPQSEDTRYIQLQIWHGHETDKPLPNIIWIDDVKVYDITNYTKPVTLDIPFKVDKTDNYKLFIRYFKNQKGGAIRVYLDGTPIYIKTKDQLNKFVWEDLGTFKLEKGKHKIVLENVRGFNAVNLFALIPEKEYNKARKEAIELLQNKTIIYLFEAESDLYRENTEIIKDFNASNGEAIKFDQKGKAWQNVEIVKNSTYRLALKGNGTFNISIGDYKYVLTVNNSTFEYTPLFYLRNGEYKLEITPTSKDALLDVVWLYSTDKNETLEELFQTNETPATVQDYTKVNPTLWKVKVNATKPFMLTFAESYDPLWEARVYKDGKLVEKVSPVPVYGVINGFWINQTGDLEIVLRYTPQDWFERGLMVSLTTFLLSVFYIFYDWRREKGDKWAKRLEKKFKN